VPSELDEETRDRIVAAAEGNPLYVEQLSSYAAEGGEGLPPTLEAVLAGRLGRLSSDERAVLQRAAVVGREFSRGAVASLWEQPVDPHLSSLVRRGFLRAADSPDPGDDGYRFHHVLLRDAAYAGLTKADRADLHQRAAAWLDRDGRGDDAVAGYHLERAVELLRELGAETHQLAAAAGERLGDAAMRAWRQNDVAAAVGLLERAAALLPISERRAELEWELAVALRLKSRPADADAALARADEDARSADASAIAARVAAEQARLALLADEIELADAAAATMGAIETLEGLGDARGLARAHLNLAGIRGIACDFKGQSMAAAAGIEHYRSARFSPAACVSAQTGALYYGPTEVSAAMLECAELLASPLDRLSAAHVTAVLGALHGYSGNAAEARSLLEAARATYADLGQNEAVQSILVPLAVNVERGADELETAVALCRDSFDTFEAQGDRAFGSTRAVQLAELLLDLGRDDEAKRYVNLADERVIRSDVLVQFLRRAQRARLLAREGDLDAAEARAREAVAISELTDGLVDRARVHGALAEVLPAKGARAEAKRERAEAARLLRRKGLNAKESHLGSPSLA
jgi:predicted ATPase